MPCYQLDAKLGNSHPQCFSISNLGEQVLSLNAAVERLLSRYYPLNGECLDCITKLDAIATVWYGLHMCRVLDAYDRWAPGPLHSRESTARGRDKRYPPVSSMLKDSGTSRARMQIMELATSPVARPRPSGGAHEPSGPGAATHEEIHAISSSLPVAPSAMLCRVPC